MSLKDDLAAMTPSITGKYGCATGSWLGTIDTEDRADIEAWVKAGHNQSQMFRVCQENGLLAGVSQFHKHWRQDCACSR